MPIPRLCDLSLSFLISTGVMVTPGNNAVEAPVLVSAWCTVVA